MAVIDIEKLLDKVDKANTQESVNENVFSKSPDTKKNEFLFFIKSELLWKDSPTPNRAEILNYIFSAIDNFELSVQNIRILNSVYLNKFDIIAQHYGVINKISREAKNQISLQGKEKFNELFGDDFDHVTILGSIEFLKKYSTFNSLSLDYLWQNIEYKKLSGGVYCGKLIFDGQLVYLVNGFHPRQLDHFTLPGRAIVVMTLEGDISWEDARGKFIGATNPVNAAVGSIRNTLFEKREKFGLKAVTSSWNGVHLSAGPVEGLVELLRYNSDFKDNKILKPDNFSFGKQLLHFFEAEEVLKIMNNEIVNFEGKDISIFDLTEEKNSDDAMNLLSMLKL